MISHDETFLIDAIGRFLRDFNRTCTDYHKLRKGNLIMICHAKRISETERIDIMKHRIRPVLIVVIMFLIAIMADGLIDVYAANKHAEEIQAASMFVSALNGAQIDTGDGIITCKVTSFKLVKGL